MGRNNRSGKRRDAMNKIKRERYAAKELVRLKKTLGLIDANGDEIMKDVSEVVEMKTPAKMTKKQKQAEENLQLTDELLEERKPGKKVAVVQEKTGVKHVYNTKTLRDQFGTYPPWFNKRKTAKRLNKIAHARKKRFKQHWCTTQVPL